MLSQFGALTLAQETQFSELPLEVVALVFLRLPLDARLRAREVSQGWRALLNEPRFWLVLDFSHGSGVEARLTQALLFAAGERGRGHLHTLDLTGTEGLRTAHLAQFAAMHAQSLRTVTVPEEVEFSAKKVTRLCRSAPLCTLRCYVNCDAAEALPLLRCEAPCALLHIFKLYVHGFGSNWQQVLDFAAALPSHRGKIKDLTVSTFPLENVAVADALMRGIAEARVRDVTFYNCCLRPASLPGLTRLLEAGCLERLNIDNVRRLWLFEASPDLTAFCHALRSSTLQALELYRCELWRDPAAADELLAALVGHSTLSELSLYSHRLNVDTDDARRVVGEHLAPLITHTSALQKLELTEIDLGKAGLAPIFEALHRSNTLKELSVSAVFHPSSALLSLNPYCLIGLPVIDAAEISRDFARDVILPAVRANSSLRKLKVFMRGGNDGTIPELVKAQAVVAARTQPAVGAIIAA